MLNRMQMMVSRDGGKLFQMSGLRTANACRLKSVRVCQTMAVCTGWCWMCRCRSDMQKATTSAMYDGHCWAVIRYLTGNQWSSRSDEMMSRRRSSRKTKRTAVQRSARVGVEQWLTQVDRQGWCCSSPCDYITSWFMGLGAGTTCGGGGSRGKQSCWHDASSSVYCARRQHCRQPFHRSVETAGWTGFLQGWHVSRTR